MSFVALDLSVRSSGWAMWNRGQERPAFGTWELAAHVDWAARGFVRLHKNLIDLHRLDPIECIYFEEPLSPGSVHGQTNVRTLYVAAGLAAHAESFAEAIGARHHVVHQATWRRHFIGKMPRGTKTPDLKHMAMQRCRELGFDPSKHDAAEALGILDYQLSIESITPPWRHGNVLQEQLRPRSAA